MFAAVAHPGVATRAVPGPPLPPVEAVHDLDDGAARAHNPLGLALHSGQHLFSVGVGHTLHTGPAFLFFLLGLLVVILVVVRLVGREYGGLVLLVVVVVVGVVVVVVVEVVVVVVVVLEIVVG